MRPMMDLSTWADRSMDRLLARLAREGISLPHGVHMTVRRRPAPVPREPARSRHADGLITVASYNIHKCIGVDKRFDPSRVADVIAELDADIVALQEADRRFGRRIGLLDMTAIERRTGLRMVPISSAPGGHGWHGNALLIRVGRVAAVRRLALPGGEPRGAVMVDLDLPMGRLRLVAAHLGLLKRHREGQAAAILAALSEGTDAPSVVIGDLNEWRLGRRSSLCLLEKSFGESGPVVPTFPSRLPMLPLDRILVNRRGLIQAVEVHNTALARIASDHLPLSATLNLGTVARAHLSEDAIPEVA